MENPTITHVFLPRNVDMEVMDDLHFLLMEYVRELEKKMKEIKKEVKDSPETKNELKGQYSLLKKMRKNAHIVLDDIEFHVKIESDEEVSDESSE
jgi:hypothetical protein